MDHDTELACITDEFKQYVERTSIEIKEHNKKSDKILSMLMEKNDKLNNCSEV